LFIQSNSLFMAWGLFYVQRCLNVFGSWLVGADSMAYQSVQHLLLYSVPWIQPWYAPRNWYTSAIQHNNMIPTLSLSLSLSASDLTEEAQAQGRARIMTTYSVALYSVITVERAISDPADNPAPLLPTNNSGPQSQLFVHSPLRPDLLHSYSDPPRSPSLHLGPIITYKFTRPNVGCLTLCSKRKATRSVW